MRNSSKKTDIPTVSIIGRPNVGKSSLFNAILGKRLAIVHQESGVTRDRVAAAARWNGRRFTIVDTGGLGMPLNKTRAIDFFSEVIRDQVNVAIENSDKIIMVVDAMDGGVPQDAEICDALRAAGKPRLLVANKADNNELISRAIDEFSELGVAPIYPVSSLHRSGVADVLDALVDDFPETVEDPAQREPLKIAVAGRPNVGKSSLVNKLLGEERVVVSERPGTTRDRIDADCLFDVGEDEPLPVTLIDTAGLRKRSKVSGAVETYSVKRAAMAVEEAQLVLFVVEANADGVTAQDRKIARLIEDKGKPCVVVVNKWDAVSNLSERDAFSELRGTLPFMRHVPSLLISARTGFHLDRLMAMVAEMKKRMEVRVPTPVLNRVIADAMKKTPPQSIRGKQLRIYYGTSLDGTPPRFLLFANDPKLCARNYRNYLINRLREAFDLAGLPVRLSFRKKTRRD